MANKKRKKQYQEQEQEQENEQVDHLICVKCKSSWHVTEFDEITNNRNPMCVVCSTIIGTNQ